MIINGPYLIAGTSAKNPNFIIKEKCCKSTLDGKGIIGCGIDPFLAIF